ncbi:pathway-specific nitrogen regulator [Phyllosticta citriasiana]|uniref:Pathway-specific nitrogen regulator n=1 Tax=Phyllosticta citriasiana TaxID=595635 RepID=A0ABR1KLE0_9PEZI
MDHDTFSNSPLPQPKAIRFVTNTDGPYAKRRRINSACLTCRRRKTRCSGERPSCETCLKNNHSCGGYGPDSGDTDARPAPKRFPKPVSTSIESTAKSTQSTQSTQSTESTASAMQPTAPQPPVRNVPQACNIDPNLDQVQDPSPEDGSQSSSRHALSLSIRNRMPYFRYFGPTAIMPGFKQMVVKVKGKQHSATGTSTDGLSSPPPPTASSLGRATPQQSTDSVSPAEIPMYDTSSVPPPPLITQLCKTFFRHLGCNFPFLQEERFMRDLEEKQVDAILVDAVCALASRFSNDPLLTRARPDAEGECAPSERGQAFAQRAKSAIADTFACPSIAVVQAALLLAYDEFGASRDSGLWMYLGIAIRMAQDLGMQTLQGLKYEGRVGQTPASVSVKRGRKIPECETTGASPETPKDLQAIEELRAVERERVDTFWSVFFLDRVVSSGTGRPVSIRDKDIELAFPSLDTMDRSTGDPLPLPALIRVIHLYGRVTDILNDIKAVSHVTPEVIKQLGSMESLLTEIYQNLSPRLHFSVMNFQHYLRTGQGTNFILLHFWFHTLIVLLHEPTLLKTFEGEIQQLLPNSHELSMSSAKTIADILAFAELADVNRAGFGNPFTSQPIYIAACAFLKESALQSASSNPHSRHASPPLEDDSPPEYNGSRKKDADKQMRHSLLASAANANYQRCYRALQSLEQYWAGTKYILTVLDQKAKGVVDPLLYTREEMESALEVPRPEPSFNTPGWRRKLSWGAYVAPTGEKEMEPHNSSAYFSASPMDAGQAIGWSLTGTMNSPSTSLAVLYPTENREHRRSQDMGVSISSVMAHGQQQRMMPSPLPPRHAMFSPPPPGLHPPPSNRHPSAPSPFHHNLDDQPTPLVSDADLLLNLHSPFSATSPPRSTAAQTHVSPSAHAHHHPHPHPAHHVFSHSQSHQRPPSSSSHQHHQHHRAASSPTAGAGPGSYYFGDSLMIESQDIDMSALGIGFGGSTSGASSDPAALASFGALPWIQYLPLPDMLGGVGGGVGGAVGGMDWFDASAAATASADADGDAEADEGVAASASAKRERGDKGRVNDRGSVTGNVMGIAVKVEGDGDGRGGDDGGGG